jgi:hypothetical protein
MFMQQVDGEIKLLVMPLEALSHSGRTVSQKKRVDLTPSIYFDWIRDNCCHQVWKTSTSLSKLLLYKLFSIAIIWETPF